MPFQKGHKLNIGNKYAVRKMSDEEKKRRSESAKKAGAGKWMSGRVNSANPAWRGDNASYRSKHTWVERRMGKANHCEECGLNEIPLGMKRYFQWANISREYKREVSDWKQMCVKCHINYDKKYV